MDNFPELEKIIIDNSKSLVGILLKRIEILENNNLTFDQIKNIYKALVKEEVYENNRFLLKLLKAKFETGSIIFTRPTQKE